MPNPAASPAVSSTVGLKNMVIAPLTVDTEETLTYGDLQLVAGAIEASITVLSRVMRKLNSVTYEVGKAKAEQASGMFGLAAGQRAASCPSRVAKPLAKPLTGGWRSATYAGSQQSAPCFSRSICSSDFMLM